MPQVIVHICLLVLIFLPINATAQYEHLMDEIVNEMNIYGAPDDDMAFSELFGSHLRYWVKLEELTTNPFMIEVNHYRYLPPTTRQYEFTQWVYQKSLETVKKNKWYIEENAIKAGYKLQPDFDPVHYPNDAFFRDGKIFDPEFPEYLIFHPTPYGRVLVGVMFQVEEHLATGPQLGGDLTVWHFHTQPGTCWVRYLRSGATNKKYCPEGKGRYSNRSPEMIHIWFVDHPEGVFGSNMGVYLNDAKVRKLKKLYSE